MPVTCAQQQRPASMRLRVARNSLRVARDSSSPSSSSDKRVSVIAVNAYGMASLMFAGFVLTFETLPAST